tara:strand:- start:1237 stop:1635 length:399 start_codon:yes stop_codon:yes gene_type:complete
MDLINLKPTSDTVEVTLNHPNTGDALLNDDGTPMVIVLHATHSKEYKKIMHEQTNKRIKAMQGGKKSEITAQDIEEASLTQLSKATASWDITYGGEKPKLSITKAKEIYDEVFWIRDQLEGALAESLDFTKA